MYLRTICELFVNRELFAEHCFQDQEREEQEVQDDQLDEDGLKVTIYKIVGSVLENDLSDRILCQQFKFVAVSDKGLPTLKKVRSID